MPILIHSVACTWIWLGSGIPGAMLIKMLEYVKAIYWIFTTLTTVGYGDIAAKSIAQMLFSCLVQVIGVGIFGYVLSNVASILSRSDAAREHHMDNLDRIETFMGVHRIPCGIAVKDPGLLQLLMWLNRKGYTMIRFLQDLPKNTV